MNQPENTPEIDEKILAKQMKLAERNRKRAEYMKTYLVEYRKPYYQTNRETVLQKQKEYNLAHADHIREMKAAWWKKKQEAKKDGALMQFDD